MKGSEYFQGAVGALFDLVFGIGGDGRRNSSAEHYDSEETLNPDIHIHGNVHQDGATQSNDAPAPVVVDASMANALALQEGYAQPSDNPVHVMSAPEYPPMPLPDPTIRPPEYGSRPSYDDLCAAAFNRAWESQDDGMRQSL